MQQTARPVQLSPTRLTRYSTPVNLIKENLRTLQAPITGNSNLWPVVVSERDLHSAIARYLSRKDSSITSVPDGQPCDYHMWRPLNIRL